MSIIDRIINIIGIIAQIAFILIGLLFAYLIAMATYMLITGQLQPPAHH